ncbi:MAG: acyl-CoA dehydrogenase family protein, partial [Deltaproteobacteria bacterium]|nr:acyl-CoA dehydrogenase family protein [Deltaproteobacteria bacterium]
MFTVTPQQLEVQRLAREFAEKEVAPLARAIDEEGRFPLPIVKKMA